MLTRAQPSQRQLDEAVAAAVRYEGTAGRAWSRLEAEVIDRCRSVLGWWRASAAQRDVIDLAVADACLWLRDVAVLGGAWDAARGATLVGSAVRYARLRLTHHARSRSADRPSSEIPVDPALFDGLEGGSDPAETVEAAEKIDAFRVHAGEAAWRFAAGQAAGWTLGELADAYDVGVRGLATRLWRARSSFSRSGW